MLRYSSLLERQIDWSDAEISAGKKYLNWEELSLNFESIELDWEDVFILLEIKGGGGKGRKDDSLYKEYVDNNPWNQFREKTNEEKTQKLIKLYCKVNKIDYENIVEKKDDIKITINDFERFVESVIVKVKL